MPQIIKPKRRHTSGAPTTSDLEPNEMAINTADFSIYVRDESNNILRVGGVQTPMTQNLDVNNFDINNGQTSNYGAPRVDINTVLRLPRYTQTQKDDLVEFDPAYAVVGDEIKVKTYGNTIWEDMGAPSNTPTSPFTVTAAAPAGTTGVALVGSEWDGLIIFDTTAARFAVYEGYQWNFIT